MATWRGGLCRFTVELSDFAVEGMAVGVDGEPRRSYLLVNFDSFKTIQSQPEPASTSPGYSIKDSFNYRTRFVEQKKLTKKFFSCEIKGAEDNELIGQCRVDLYTLACGPDKYEMSLLTEKKQPAGVLKFTCTMRMFSMIEISLTRLRVQDIEQGCQLAVYPSCDGAEETEVPYAKDGCWMDRSYQVVFETHLWDLLDPDECEDLRFSVMNQSKRVLGEARVPFRSHFSLTGQPVEFSVPVSSSDQVGLLSGVMKIDALPAYAQMKGAVGVDNGKVMGGFLLYPGLPHPEYFSTPPPALPVSQPNKEDFGGGRSNASPAAPAPPRTSPPPTNVTFQIPMPPHWQRRFDKNSNLFYYADSRVKKTCWMDPRLLPPGWDQRIDPSSDNKIYYADHNTRKTTFVDPRGCPAGWEMRLMATDGRPYFAFAPSRKTTFTDPRGCPPGVTPALDEKGKMYFRHHATRTTSWDDPRANARKERLDLWKLQEHAAWREAEIHRLEAELNRQHEAALNEEG